MATYYLNYYYNTYFIMFCSVLLLYNLYFDVGFITVSFKRFTDTQEWNQCCDLYYDVVSCMLTECSLHIYLYGCLSLPLYMITCSHQASGATSTANFVLSDNVYAVAEVPPTDTVYLWLGVSSWTYTYTCTHTHSFLYQIRMD